jgi:hypothetical protein
MSLQEFAMASATSARRKPLPVLEHTRRLISRATDARASEIDAEYTMNAAESASGFREYIAPVSQP